MKINWWVYAVVVLHLLFMDFCMTYFFGNPYFNSLPAAAVFLLKGEKL